MMPGELCFRHMLIRFWGLLLRLNSLLADYSPATYIHIDARRGGRRARHCAAAYRARC